MTLIATLLPAAEALSDKEQVFIPTGEFTAVLQQAHWTESDAGLLDSGARTLTSARAYAGTGCLAIRP